MTPTTRRQRVLIHLAYQCHEQTRYDHDRTPGQVVEAFIERPPPVNIRFGGEGRDNWTRIEGFGMTTGEAVRFRAMIAAIEANGPYDDDRDILQDTRDAG